MKAGLVSIWDYFLFLYETNNRRRVTSISHHYLFGVHFTLIEWGRRFFQDRSIPIAIRCGMP